MFEKPSGSRLKKIGLTLLFLILLGVIALETAIIISQRNVNQQIEAQSQKSLSRFLKQGQTASGENGTSVLMKNVRFCWSKEICINTDYLTGTLLPVKIGNDVIFDDIKGFIVNVHKSNVLISPKTLQGMFNESIFNYPGSNLRNLTVEIDQGSEPSHVSLKGSLNYIFWIPFSMDTNLAVDQKTNTLVISVNTLHVFGFLPVTWFIHFKPFNLDKLLTVPKNKFLTVRHNLIMVKPFGLFPPPRISGKMASIVVNPTMIQLRFAGTSLPEDHVPSPGSANYIYLEGGNTRFGLLKMFDSHIQVIDENPGTLFQFSLMNYLHYLPLSQLKLQKEDTVVVHMPDHATPSK